MNVYDFDNTIYAGESCFDLFLFYVRKHPDLLRLLPKVVFAFAKYKRGKVTVEEFLERYAPLVEEKLRQIPDIEADMLEFWDGHMHKIKPWYAELRQPDDLWITAAPDFSMHEVCERLGVGQCLATRVEPSTGKILHFNLRERKIDAFRAGYADAEIEKFYTDSPENDAPLIALAKEAFVVKGDRITKVK